MKRILLLPLLMISIIATAQDPVTVDPARYRVLFENTHMRVLEYRDKPGDKAPMHSHLAYMTYVTGSGKVRDTLPNGESSIDEIAGSEFACLPPTTHAGQNIGNTGIQELLVEFKDATNPCSGERSRATSSEHGQAAQAEEEILSLQDALIAAYIDRDTAALDRLLADEYTFINDDAGGVVNKKQILDSFKSGGDREITSYKRQDDHVRIYGDVALLTYRYQSTETYKGRENGGDFRVTRIFVNRDGRWQIVGGQETRVLKPQPDSISSSANDVLALKQLEQNWLDSYREGDAEKMSKILADDFVGRWADGSTQTKAEQLKAIRTGEEKHSSNHLDECNVRICGETAVVTGLQTEESMLEGRNGSGTYSYTDVFVKRDGRWQIVATETKRVSSQASRNPSAR